jgi:hypothetical protein
VSVVDEVQYVSKIMSTQIKKKQACSRKRREKRPHREGTHSTGLYIHTHTHARTHNTHTHAQADADRHARPRVTKFECDVP